MPLPPKPLPERYTLAVRRTGEPYVYIRPDGTRSRPFDRRIRAVDAAWIEDGMRKAGMVAHNGGGETDGTL